MRSLARRRRSRSPTSRRAVADAPAPIQRPTPEPTQPAPDRRRRRRAAPTQTAAIDDRSTTDDDRRVDDAARSDRREAAAPALEVGDVSFELHGYARMPLDDAGHAREPYLVDNDYYLSGFAYTRLYEPDWSELFFCAKQGRLQGRVRPVRVAVLRLRAGAPREPARHRAGLASPRSNFLDVKTAQRPARRVLGSLRLHRAVRHVHLRPHAPGRRRRSRTSCPAAAASRPASASTRRSSSRTSGSRRSRTSRRRYPVGPVDVGAYVLRTWTRDKRQLSPIQDGTMYVAGLDARYKLPHDRGSVVPRVRLLQHGQGALPRARARGHALDRRPRPDRELPRPRRAATTAPATCTRSPTDVHDQASPTQIGGARVRHGDVGALAAGRRDGSAEQQRSPPLPQVGRRAELPARSRSSRVVGALRPRDPRRLRLARTASACCRRRSRSRSTTGASCSSCTRTTGTATRSTLRPGQVPLETDARHATCSSSRRRSSGDQSSVMTSAIGLGAPGIGTSTWIPRPEGQQVIEPHGRGRVERGLAVGVLRGPVPVHGRLGGGQRGGPS